MQSHRYMKRVKKNKLLQTAKWTAIGACIGDVAALAAGYYYYQQLKNSRDFRYKVYNYDPRFIDVYYRANEKYGDGMARQQDYKEWGIQKVDSFSFISLLGL